MTTFSDTDIKAAMAEGKLVRGGADKQVGPACYELRMGEVYYDLTESDRPINAASHQTILIKPGHRVVLITLEELAIPDDVIARVSSKGSLFSIGLTPVSTYADPGFRGNLGIVTQNQSDKFIEIPIGEPIAKIDFSLLSSPSMNPYQGQHGFQTQIWPIRHNLQKGYSELRNDSRVDTEIAESYKILPRPVANVLQGIRSKQRRTDWAIFAALLMNSLVLVSISTKYFDTVISLASNLITTAIVGVIIWLSRRKD